jgi:LacI family transcriptional regulator
LVVANPRGSTLIESIETERQFLRRLAEDTDICGVILWYLGGETNLPWLERLRAMRMPMVFVDRRPPDRCLGDYVGVDNRHAASQVVNHLLSRGHRRIAHITNEESACTVAERLGGYRDSLQQAGIAYDPDLVLTGPFQEPEEIRYTAILERLRGLPNSPTAVFAVNDYSALCLVASAGAMGLSVPEDIEVAGFDDLERWRPGPAILTTVSQPFERMGIEAAGLLLERLDTKNSDTFTSVLMDAPLVVRAGIQFNGL